MDKTNTNSRGVKNPRSMPADRGRSGGMLGDPDIERLESQLGEFRAASRQAFDTEQGILQQYEQLLEAYRRLRSDFEEERESRERYKKLARGQERNPFVLLLVDLDGYIFNDQLVKAGKDGGPEAAQLLKLAVKDAIQSLGEDADRCRIVFRGYTNLQGLSIAMARAGLAGLEARSLAPFASTFTRAEDLFDIVDAGDKKDAADLKIRELFRLFVDNSQCRHIYFGACHDPAYLSLLAPWRGKSDKVSLIRTGSFQNEFLSLGLDVVEFPTVFRSAPLNNIAPNSPQVNRGAPQQQGKTASPKIVSPQKNAGADKKPCVYFQQGKCRHGDTCKFSHGSHGSHGSHASHASHASHPSHGSAPAEPRQPVEPPVDQFYKSMLSQDWRSPPPMETASPPNRNDNRNDNNDQLGPRQVSNSLPASSPANAGLIPINRNNERLDTFVPPPTTEQWERFNRRIQEKKLCNRYQLNGTCPEMDKCPYDHRPITLDILHTLKYVARGSPCSKQGACRSRSCLSGHICSKDGCWGGSGCKLKYKMHLIDPVPAKWVQPTDDRSPNHSPDGVYDDFLSRGSSPSPNGATNLNYQTVHW